MGGGTKGTKALAVRHINKWNRFVSWTGHLGIIFKNLYAFQYSFRNLGRFHKTILQNTCSDQSVFMFPLAVHKSQVGPAMSSTDASLEMKQPLQNQMRCEAELSWAD